MSDDILLEPLKAYRSVYKQAVNDEAIRYFDELVNRAGVDVAANRKTISELKAKRKKAQEVKKKLAGLRTGKVFSIIGIVLGFIMSAFCVYLLFTTPFNAVCLILSIVGVLLGVGLIILLVKVINPKIKNQDLILDKLNQKIAELEKLAAAQMAPLNALYDWNIPTQIIEKVIPILDFDKYFDGSKYYSLIKNYGFAANTDVNQSALFVQSGTILGNPFLVQRYKSHAIYNKAYTGSIVITWTESYRDSQGNYHTRTRTQTLTATTYHPAPNYTYHTALIYGNDAAPDLSFSRKPSGMSGKDQKTIDKYVRKHEDELRKRAEKSIKNGDPQPYTPLANSEFELLFGAHNRDHNVQFRLLFTPLAQKNQCDLIKSTDGFGDDYYLSKNKKVNTISSSHSQGQDYTGNPSVYFDIDHDRAKDTFVKHVNAFFKGIYFDLAPLLAIPLYQQMKSLDYIYGRDCPQNYSSYEHEVFANSFDENLLKHPDSITTCMLKTNVIRTDGKGDKVSITAYSYRGEERVDYVQKMGGDGHLHTIPVYWTEYIPISQVSTMELRNVNSSRFDFNNKIQDNRLRDFILNHSNGGNYSFARGLMAILGGENYTSSHDKELDSIFGKEE